MKKLIAIILCLTLSLAPFAALATVTSEGDYAAKITGTANKHIWANVAVTGGTTYTVTWDFKGATNSSYAIYLYDATHGNTPITNYAGKNTGDGWAGTRRLAAP